MSDGTEQSQVLQLLTAMRAELSAYVAESRQRHTTTERDAVTQAATLQQLDSRVRTLEVASATATTRADTRWQSWAPVVSFIAAAALAIGLTFLRR